MGAKSEQVVETTTKVQATLASKKLNSRRYVWLFVGYYIFVILIRASKAQGSEETTTEEQEHVVGEHHGGIHLFKVDWPNVESIFIITIWIFCASIAKIAFHMTPKLGHIFPESCLLIIVGILIGFVLYAADIDMGEASLPTNTFFFFMLPPIILDAGYFMPNRLFFGNLGTILLFAVIGTIWNTFAIGITLWGFNQIDLFDISLNAIEIFLFSSLISAVDPVAVLAVFEEVHVNDILYIVVFGESLLNDAVSIVLYRTCVELTRLGPDHITTEEVLKGVASFPIVALGGTIIGIIFGFITGFATRFTNHALIIEPVIVFVVAYLAFLTSELFHFSGVLTLIFCGITMKNYVNANIAPTSNTTVRYTMKMLSSASETIIFIFLGTSTVNNNNIWNWWFVLITVVACLVYRFMGVFFFTAIVNHFRMNKLGFVDQVVMGYGGLRGAVSFALVLLIDEETIRNEKVRHMFVTTTIVVVYFTVFIQGTTIKPLVEWLRVKRAQPRVLTMSEKIHERLMAHTVTSVESILGATIGHNQIREKFRSIDTTYIRPLIIRDFKDRQELKLIEAYENLMMQDASDEIRTRKSMKVDTLGNKIEPIPEGSSEDEEKQEQQPKPILEKKVSFEPMSPLPIRTVLERSRSASSSTQPKFSDVSAPIIDNSNISDIFVPIRQRKMSYNRHGLDYNDLDLENYSYVDTLSGTTSPAGVVGRRVARKMGVANAGTFNRPLRTSRDEYLGRYSTGIAPNPELLQQQQQPQSGRLFRPVRRTTSSGPSPRGRPSSTSGSTSIAEDDEEARIDDHHQTQPAQVFFPPGDADSTTAAPPSAESGTTDISSPNVPSDVVVKYDEVFEK